MPPGLRLRKTYMNPEQCFRLWLETGSLYKAQKRLVEIGVINERTGKPPTPTGIQNSAELWMIHHPGEAKTALESYYKASGNLLTNDDWVNIMSRAAKRVIQSDKKLNLFFAQHSYLNPNA